MTTNLQRKAEIQHAVSQGLKPFNRPPDLRLSEWAEKYFYLSPESSYVEKPWEAYPYQVPIMDCMSNDDIREVDFIKSARIGATKMMVASMGYYAQHKKRNQAFWQPTDDDADEFVKTELEPMIRDCPAVREVFPYHDKKSKFNTLRQKMFRGSTLYIRGGKAAKNYRRISPSVVYGDELNGFGRDIEKEGKPRALISKRVEGATFPKEIYASTPTIKGESNIDDAVAAAGEMYFRFYIPCPKCGEMHYLQFGGKDVAFGFKWEQGKPWTAKYMCGSCLDYYTQADYLNVWHEGRMQTESGIWIDPDGIFRDSKNKVIETPSHVAFHVWTAYSPQTTWTQLVREFLECKQDRSALKSFVNLTLGESWEEDVAEKLEHQYLYLRREHYSVPKHARAITFGIDTQDDRFEVQFDAWGAGEERWSIGYRRLYGDLDRAEIWQKLAEILLQKFHRADGMQMQALLGCQDYGGHYPDEVAEFSKRMGTRFLIPVRGASMYGKPVLNFPRKPSVKGVYLTEVGTDTAKDVLYHRLKLGEPGPAYWHFPHNEQFDEEYFRQLTNEVRQPKWTTGGIKRYVWDAGGRRQEPWDCSVYSFVAIRIAQQHFGLNLEYESPEVPKGQTRAPAGSSKRRVRSRGLGR